MATSARALRLSPIAAAIAQPSANRKAEWARQNQTSGQAASKGSFAAVGKWISAAGTSAYICTRVSVATSSESRRCTP